MKLSDLAEATATLDEYDSYLLFTEVVSQPWRCYGETTVGLEKLIDRFMANHARVPGLVTATTASAEPVSVFRYTRPDGDRAEGALWLNGAVVTLFDHTTTTTASLLFVAPIDAELWGYPDTNYVLYGSATPTP